MSDISTTSASAAQILGQRALYGFGMIEISGGFHPTLQTGRDLRLSGSGRQCQEPRFWLVCPTTFRANRGDYRTRSTDDPISQWQPAHLLS